MSSRSRRRSSRASSPSAVSKNDDASVEAPLATAAAAAAPAAVPAPAIAAALAPAPATETATIIVVSADPQPSDFAGKKPSALGDGLAVIGRFSTALSLIVSIIVALAMFFFLMYLVAHGRHKSEGGMILFSMFVAILIILPSALFYYLTRKSRIAAIVFGVLFILSLFISALRYAFA